jgi:hypothetical protein
MIVVVLILGGLFTCLFFLLALAITQPLITLATLVGVACVCWVVDWAESKLRNDA